MTPPSGQPWPLVVLATAGFAAAPVPVTAQTTPTLEVAAAATVLRNPDVFEGSRPGWLLGTSWRFFEHVGVGLEVGRNSGESTLGFLTARTQTSTAMAGPRVTWTIGPVRTFARMLAGAARQDVELATTGLVTSTGSFASTHRAISVGGGVDVPVMDRLVVRTAYDLRRVFVDEPHSEHRLLVGAVYTLR